MKRIYEDENWIIDIVNDDDYNPQIRISCFKNGNFVDDLELSRQAMEDITVIGEIKNILYK